MIMMIMMMLIIIISYRMAYFQNPTDKRGTAPGLTRSQNEPLPAGHTLTVQATRTTLFLLKLNGVIWNVMVVSGDRVGSCFNSFPKSADGQLTRN